MFELANLDTLLSYAHEREEVLWVESLDIGGGALHCVIEDGNLDDSSIQFCLSEMLASRWDGYGSLVKPGDRHRFMALANRLLTMPPLYRELIVHGSTVSELVFDRLHDPRSKAASNV